jgi:hypothetical protein
MSSIPARKPYPSAVSDEEWSLGAPYITLMTETAPQRDHPMRELLNALRYVVRYGIAPPCTTRFGKVGSKPLNPTGA